MSSLTVPSLAVKRDSLDTDATAPATPTMPGQSPIMSPTNTFVNLTALKDKESDEGDTATACSLKLQKEKDADEESTKATTTEVAKRPPPMSAARKWGLLAMFSAAMFIDSEYTHSQPCSVTDCPSLVLLGLLHLHRAHLH